MIDLQLQTSESMIVIRRPLTHHKGPKTIAVWPYGQPVPKGIIIGKDAVITIEEKEKHSNQGGTNGIQS